MSKTELQTTNQQNELAVWSDQIADCRSSGQPFHDHRVPRCGYFAESAKYGVYPALFAVYYASQTQYIRAEKHR